MTTTAERRALYLDEPALEFAGGQLAVDPHDGLALYGPFSAGSASHPRTPPYMVIGTSEGIVAMRAWCAAMNRAWATTTIPRGRQDPNYRLWPPFPGFEAAFGAPWSEEPAATFTLDRDQILEASRRGDAHERCFAIVQQFLAGFERTRKLDVKIGVALCVVPDEIWSNCRPESRVVNPSSAPLSRSARASRRMGQSELFEAFEHEQYQFSHDFRRQLKARTMRYDIPVQIIRESTLRLSDEVTLGERRLTPLSDRMWNIGSALYYKCGGKPWKLATVREGVCYVGIAFRRVSEGSNTACCAAQMFLDSGDGIVFLGEYGPWYSAEDRQFHLDRRAARDLLAGTLRTYAELEGRPLKEIFLHCRSSIDRDEFEGFQEGCPPDCKLIGIRVRPHANGPRLYRKGRMPVLRGTFVPLHERRGLLFGSGFKPRLGTYDGWETPIPLRIDIQHGAADIEQVARDILGLSKLNYNACKLGESQPVTVGFSDAVGEILISNPTVTERRAQFKYYI